MIVEHADAIDIMLSAGDLDAFDGEVEGDPDRYVVFYLTTPAETTRRMTADSPKVRFLLSTMYVGRNPFEARWVADQVAERMVGSRLAVSGRLCTPFLRPVRPVPIRPDESLNPPRYTAVDVWPFTSSPAAA